MFRVAPKDYEEPDTSTEAPEEGAPAVDVMPADAGAPTNAPQQTSATVDPSVAMYMGGEYGPFRCDNCAHFMGPSACEVVTGQIDPSGCCNIFTPSGQMAEMDNSQSPEEEAAEPPSEEQGETDEEEKAEK